MKYLLWFLILTLPFQFALNVSESFDLAVTRILIPAIFLIWLVRGLARREVWVPKKMEAGLAAIFIFISFASILLGEDWSRGVRKLVYFFSIFPIFLVGADLFKDSDVKEKTVKFIALGGFLAALAGIIQFGLQFVIGLDSELDIFKKAAPIFLGQSFGELVVTNPSWLVNVSGETLMRAFGFFPDPHMFSFFVSLAFFTGLGYFFKEEDRSSKILLGTGLTVMFLAIFFSFTRGAYLGVFAGIMFFTAPALCKAGWFSRIAVAFLAIVILLIALNPGAISQRLISSFNLKEGSNLERLKNWQQALDVIRDYPVLGVGLGNYASIIKPTVPERSSIYAHNLFLDIAAETGVANGVIFLSLILISIWRQIKNGRIVNLGIASGLICFLVHSVFDTPLFSPQVLCLLLIILAIGIHSKEDKLKAQNSKCGVAV